MIRRPPRSTLFPTRRSSDLDRHGTLEHYIAVKVRLLKQASKTGQIVIVDADHDLAGLRGLFQQSHLHGNIVFECAVPVEIGRASCREECRSRWSPYH